MGTQTRRGVTEAVLLISPAYIWLTVAIFLPLSAMLFFSFLSDVTFGEREWAVTLENYATFFQKKLYYALLWKSLELGLIVTGLCLLIGFPCAYVLAKTVKGRWRDKNTNNIWAFVEMDMKALDDAIATSDKLSQNFKGYYSGSSGANFDRFVKDSQ